jgi:hypothetical protein
MATTTLKEAIKPYYKDHKWASLLNEQPSNVWDFWEQFWTWCETNSVVGNINSGTKLAAFVYMIFNATPIDPFPTREELGEVFNVSHNEKAALKDNSLAGSEFCARF